MISVFRWINSALISIALTASLPVMANESVASAPKVTPVEHVRGLEQTFLTYPEWFLVFSERTTK
jgi:hypothetical protein